MGLAQGPQANLSESPPWGHVHLLWGFQVLFWVYCWDFCRRVKCRHKCQHCPSCHVCMPPKSQSVCLSVGHMFIECWSCAHSLRLSPTLTKWPQSIQSAVWTATQIGEHRNLTGNGASPSSDLCVGWADHTVSTHFLFNRCWELTFPFIWVLALRASPSYFPFFLYRSLPDKFLLGTIPPQISMLTGLVSLYVPTWNKIIEWLTYILWVFVLHASLSHFHCEFDAVLGIFMPISSKALYQMWSQPWCS